MEPLIIIAVIATGVVAGFINTIAGSGSLLTLPLLMAIGLPANVANGTNRIAILLQNAVGVGKFKQKNVLNFKTDYKLAIPAIIGSVLGANLAINLNDKIIELTVGALLVVMFFLIVFKPDKWIKEQAGNIEQKHSIIQYIVFFFIGVYGGFIQAGVGFFLLAGLVLSAGYDLVKANAIKVFIVLAYTIFALAVFIYNQQVDYIAGLTLALGNMTGAWFGAKFAVEKGAKYVRYFLLGTIIIAALHLFGAFKFIFDFM